MPRRAKVDRPIEKRISLPESVCARVDMLLWSELESKVPFGGWAAYVQALIEADLERRAEHRSELHNLLIKL